ncbi:amino acid adenylation domain-containing protein [Streptomyces sp. NPDC005438]|uniref:amino acid adenylation domain-containing protein n=1 Tax=Streptomyces sp. NPDC005438 TaxID=3156880 RepID=UPI0033A205B4
MTPLQEGLLFHAVFNQNELDVYSIQLVLDMEGPLDAERMRTAGELLLERHPNLRAAFRYRKNGEPVQLIPARAQLPWVEMDLRTLSEEHRQAEVRRVTDEERVYSFDVGRPPLMRLVLLRQPEDRYRLLLTAHQMLFDGWSMPILVKELFALYADGGRDLEVPAPYKSYLTYLSQQDRPAAERAWKEALDELPSPTLVAPQTGDRAPLMPEHHVLDLPADYTTGLTDWARAHGFTLNTLVQGAWAATLAMLTGQRDVVFGGTTSGRPPELPGVEGMVGLFINNLPVRVTLDPNKTFEQVLRELQDRQTRLLPHQHLSLTQIRQELGSGELFDTALVFENYPLDASEMEEPAPGLRITGFEAKDATHYPLSLMVMPGERLHLDISYAPDLYTAAQASEVCDRLVYLLHRLTTGADRPLAQTPLLLPGEHRDVMTLPQSPPPEDAFTDVVPHIRALAQAQPQAVAVVDDHERLSYEELVGRASALSRALVDRGVGPGTLVGVLSAPGTRFVTAILGVLGAGAAWVPLDVGAPLSRTSGLVADAGIGMVLADEAHVPLAHEVLATEVVVNAGTPPVFTLTTDLDAPDALLPTVGQDDDLAYVIFTSGSTGKPKGAMVHRRGMVNHLLAKVEDLGLTGGDTVVHNAPVTFDISVWQMLCALVTGGQLRVVSKQTASDPAELFGLVPAERISILEVVPSLLRATIETWDAGAAVPDLTSLRYLVVTGEALPADLCDRWLTYFPDIPLVNAYGPTECSDDVTHAVIDRDFEVGSVTAPIGTAVRNTGLYVLGDDLQPLPLGVPGELYVGGIGVGRGYLADARRTGQVFLPDPYSSVPGARMYRTGDRVVQRADGQLEFLERVDHQVKIRGHRIELGEIEARLRALPEVTDAVVTVAKDNRGEGRLVGYLAGTADQELARTALGEVLPDYMVPSAFVVMDALPLTPNGKVDRKALPAPQVALSSGREPRTEREELLCSAFGEVLGLGTVSIDESFFDLGGHSLLATRLVSRVRALMGVELSVREIFEHPTPVELAERLGDAEEARARMTVGERPEVLPLSYAQQRMWFLNRLEGAESTYNLPWTLRLHGHVDPVALEAALNDVVDRHESLRTIFPDSADGEAFQQILPSAKVPWEAHQVTAQQVEERIQEVARRGFDLSVELPLRAALFTLSPSEHVLVTVIHHIAADGWSNAPLARDLSRAYTARLRQEQPQWRAMPAQYADYALWQRETLGDDSDPESLISRQLEFWRKTLDGIPDELQLPTDHPRPPVPTYRGGTVEFTVPATTHARATELARERGASMFMVVQAALSVLLSKLGAGEDIPVGTPVAGRTDESLNDLVGLFVNTLVVRTDLSGDPTFRELVDRVRHAGLAAFENQDLPFEKLVDAVAPSRSMARHPLFQVLLAFQNNAAAEFTMPGVQASVESASLGSARFDLSLDMAEERTGRGEASGIVGKLEYSADLFTEEGARTIAERLCHLLSVLTEDPARRLSEVPSLLPGEDQRLLHEWNGEPEHRLPLIHERFSQWAAACPQRTALRYQDQWLTYRELEERSNRLARILVSHGVGPERVVAISLPRSAGMVVAALAVLKAGGSYLPIDLSYPADRIRYMMEDARPVLVISKTDLLDAFPELVSAHRLCMDTPEMARALATLPGHPLTTAERHADPHPENPAYIIYTSGSTGRPKGVVVPMRSFNNFLAESARHLQMTEGDTLVSVTTFGFDICNLELFVPLLSGATLVIAGHETVRDPAELAKMLTGVGATVMQATPTLWKTMVTEHPESLRGLHAMTGGEAISPELALELAKVTGRLTNWYGPTETTIWSSKAELDTTRAPHIGRPLAGNRVLVLDSRLRPVPVGVTGELYIGGPAVTRGYHDRPGLTATRFVADPTGPAGARIYRTGDLVRWRADGTIDYLGRVDYQVKLRGFRIELGEIESAMLSHPRVHQAVVVLREDASGEKQLVGYLVPAGGPGVDIAELRTHLEHSLPGYMVPALFAELTEMPLTPNAKVDRKALPEPERPVSQGGRPPSTPTEQALCHAIAQVLGLGQVGAEDSFFDLGGDSIRSIKLVSKARELGLAIAPADVFMHRTAAGLATVAKGQPVAVPAQAAAPAPQPTQAAQPQRPVNASSHEDTTVIRLDRLPGRVRGAAKAPTAPQPTDPRALNGHPAPATSPGAPTEPVRTRPTAQPTATQEAFAGVLPIRPNGTKAPLFCVHGGGGLGWPFMELAGALPDDIPVYALQAAGIVSEVAQPTSVREMASQYVRRISQIQPHGPYHLLGWSYGGLLAHEMAIQLSIVGERVALLANLDGFPADGTTGQDLDGQSLLNEILLRTGYTMAASANLTVGEALDLFRRTGNPLAELDETQLGRLLDVVRELSRLGDEHTPGRYEGDLLLLTAGQEQPPPNPEVWRPYVGGQLVSRTVDSDHHGMLAPRPAAQIAGILREFIGG